MDEESTHLIKHYSTRELIDELKTREGVYTSTLDIDVTANVKVTGPAIALVICD